MAKAPESEHQTVCRLGVWQGVEIQPHRNQGDGEETDDFRRNSSTRKRNEHAQREHHCSNGMEGWGFDHDCGHKSQSRAVISSEFRETSCQNRIRLANAALADRAEQPDVSASHPA